MTDTTDESADEETQSTHCTICGADLTDPKNRGDPDTGGEWVCMDPICRIAHDRELLGVPEFDGDSRAQPGGPQAGVRHGE